MRCFTEEELAIAKSADLVAVAEALGYSPKRIGRFYTLKEMDSMRIYNRKNWFRWSRQYDKGHNGGSQIDFLKEFAGLDVREAVFWLLDFVGYNRVDKKPVVLKHQTEPERQERKAFCLPPAFYNNDLLYSYLCNERGISREVVTFFVSKKLIYESRPYHNIVFKGNDKDGVTRFASMRGVFDRNGKSFKCDVAGNDKRYGFNVVCNESKDLIVFEAAIDLMSYVDILSDYESNMLALGMLSDAPLETFLKEHPQVSSIRFCLDGDQPGRAAAKYLTEKYAKRGYAVKDTPPPTGYKDYNEWLVAQRKTRAVTSKSAVTCKK